VVRLQNITLGSLRVVFTFIFLAFFVGAVAQNTPPPRPAVCDTPPRPSLSIGGDFNIVGPASALTNTICLESSQDSIKLDFSVNNPPAIGAYTVSTSYIQNIKNVADIDTALKPVTSFYYKEGYYWTTQFGINAANDSYYSCKLISLVKRQPVTASIVTCGSSAVTVTIPSVNELPTNNHSKYIIEWGPGITPTELTATGSELKASRIYAPTSPVIVRGVYTDEAGNEILCPTQPFIQFPDPSNIIYIDKVEKKANLTDYEIGFKGFVQNTAYEVSYAVDDGNYVWIGVPDQKNGVAEITGLDPAQDYCFKITYIDNCGVAGINSNVVCSISLNANVTSDTQVDLDWNEPRLPTGIIQQNDLYKDELNCPAGSNCFNLLPLSSQRARTHTYNGLKCSSIFTFQVINIFSADIGGGKSGQVEVISNTVEIDPATLAKPPKPVFLTIVDYSADITANEVNFNITFENPANAKTKYNFYRSVGGSSTFTLIGTGTDNRFIDTNVDPGKENYCYKYTYFDVCGNESEQSDAYCTIFLTSKSPNQLDWTQYVIPNVSVTDDVLYTIEFIDENGAISVVTNTRSLSESVAAQISSTDAPKVSFRILATQTIILPSGFLFPIASRSNVYTFDLPAAAFIPSAFTPNNDGINDVFKPELRFVQSGTMIIYDRWGSIVFETTDLNIGWDGTEASGSRLAPVGTYTYKIRTIGEDNVPTFLTGPVTLIR
jgi:gliding motility-associated-like protein